ncbi:hypothetical protein K438DRAFT_1972865 [Mycena galopus ATCC 62051]|nr:hypothetical protein K438DRAFT_1972865 [Mycena galopus ATCC 62051]
MTDCRSLTNQQLRLSAHGATPDLAISKSTPWLTEMIFCAKVIAADAQVVPTPCIENQEKLFGISTTSAFKALIFHDEIIPLTIYRKFYRPQSDLV